MDLGSLLTLLLLAVLLASQPWSVLAAIALVTSERGVPKEVAYVVGWMTALLVVAAAAVVVQPGAQQSTTGTVRAWVELVLGVALLAWFGARLLRPAPAVEPAGPPSWMSKIDSMSLLGAAVLGAFLPNYVVVLAAVSEMLRSEPSTAGLVTMALAFVVVASLGVAAPLLVIVTHGERAPAVYGRWREWLELHVRVVMSSLGVFVGVVLVGRGLAALL